MKSIFTQVINRGDYDLTALLEKVDKYHIEGKLTDTDRDDLYNQARKQPTAQYNYDVEINAIWDAIHALQNSGGSNEEETVVEEYKQPTGAHDAYMKGNKVMFNGVVYECLQDYCVYSPAVMPSYWMVSE